MFGIPQGISVLREIFNLDGFSLEPSTVSERSDDLHLEYFSLLLLHMHIWVAVLRTLKRRPDMCPGII